MRQLHYTLISSILLLLVFLTEAQAQSYYWIGFRDKANSTYSVSQPEKFLSARSIQRRIRQNIAIHESDLPVSQSYIASVVKEGAILVHSSKWLNGITVRLPNDTLVKSISKLSFVREIQLSKPQQTLHKSAFNKFGIFNI